MSKKEDLQDENQSEDIGFFSHIEELRKRIVFALIGVIIGCIISGIFIDDLMNLILLGPATAAKITLQNLRPFGIPFLYFKVIFIVGFIISFPFILYQLWKFIEPGLYRTEKKWARKITFFTSICFFFGVAFAYFFMIPTMLNFAASFGSDKIQNNIDVNEYFGFITMMMLAAGLIFEMPMLSYILAKFEIITSKTLTKYWRHSIIAIFVIAAVVTPTPDPINQMLFAIPLLFLYMISIWVAKLSEKKEIQV